MFVLNPIAAITPRSIARYPNIGPVLYSEKENPADDVTYRDVDCLYLCLAFIPARTSDWALIGLRLTSDHSSCTVTSHSDFDIRLFPGCREPFY